MSKPTVNHDPQVINFPDQAPAWDHWGNDVRKIVLGPSPSSGGDEKKRLKLDRLPDDLAVRYPRLTQLYLWRLEGLERLPALPATLACLDLRGCADLRALPDLPDTLETLDIGQCARIERLPVTAPTSLKRFFFDGCTALKSRSLEAFLEAQQPHAVEEIDGSAAPAVRSLEVFPKTALRKLVLKNCPNLDEVSQMAEFLALDHLNLSGCAALRSLPDLPPHLRYLVLHGAEQLKSFRGQDIGPYDRGAENQNVAKAFLSRKKFGRDLAPMVGAKLLLLGDGGVGKTTLVKRLQWEEMDEVQRRANPELAPRGNEAYTPRVQFGRWETGLKLTPEKKTALEKRAAEGGVKVSWTDDGLLRGSVRLWDFGGQELYHATHRIFAREGSVFLIVWCPEEVEERPRPPHVGEEEWREWNRKRSLDYWLDYVHAIKPEGARIALVCTRCPNPKRFDKDRCWQAFAPRHGQRTDLPSFQVDSLAPACGSHEGYRQLVAWIRDACAQEADHIGILQPAFFSQVSGYLDGLLADNRETRRQRREPRHLLVEWKDWVTRLRENHQKSTHPNLLPLDEADVETITDTLHQSGQLFRIQYDGQRAVLVDQDWAAEWIYKLLKPDGKLRDIVKAGGGLFRRSELVAELVTDRDGREFKNASAREQLIAYMIECQVITLLADARASRLGDDIYLASDKWLLPKYVLDKDVVHADYYGAELKRRVDAELKQVKSLPNMREQERFAFKDLVISEFDYRALTAYLANLFGVRGHYFRNCLQIVEASEPPSWCLRVMWIPEQDQPDSFLGSVDAVLVSTTGAFEKVTGAVSRIFDGEKSPFHGRCQVVRKVAAREYDLDQEFLAGVRAGNWDLGVSSSGKDKTQAEALVGALEVAAYRPLHYRREACRLGDMEGLKRFMFRLLNERRMMLVVSAGYLANAPEENWYCAWELADAMVRLGKGERAPADTMLVMIEGDGLRSADFREKVNTLLETMEKFFRQQYAARVQTGDEGKFAHYRDLYACFQAARRDDIFNRFMEVCGNDGVFWPYAEICKNDYQGLIAKVQQRFPPGQKTKGASPVSHSSP